MKQISDIFWKWHGLRAVPFSHAASGCSRCMTVEVPKCRMPENIALWRYALPNHGLHDVWLTKCEEAFMMYLKEEMNQYLSYLNFFNVT